MVAKVRQEPDGWYVKIDFKQIRKSKKCESEEAAQELADKVNTLLEIQGEQALVTLGLTRDGGSSIPSIAEFGEKWIKDLRSTDLSRTTVDRYAGILRVHINPEFGNKRLDRVRYRDLKAFVMAKSQSRILSGRQNRKLSKDSLRLIVTTLRRLFAEAVEGQYIENSPVKPSLNRFYRGSKRLRDHPDPFTRKELEKVLKQFFSKYPAEYPFILTMARTGMRFGEVAALKWKDLDLGRGKIHVRRSIPANADLKEPKTKSSRRTIDMAVDLKTVLKRLEKTRLEEALKEGRHEPSEWLFLREGGVIDASNLNKKWKRVLKQAKVRYRNPHQLRHTFASRLLSMGAPLLYVSKQLGHSNPQVTLTYYSKWIPSEDSVSWVDRMDGDPEELEPQKKKG